MVRKSPHEAGSALAGPAERTTKPAASAASAAPVLARLLDMVPPHLVPSALVRTLRDSQGAFMFTRTFAAGARPDLPARQYVNVWDSRPAGSGTAAQKLGAVSTGGGE